MSQGGDAAAVIVAVAAVAAVVASVVDKEAVVLIKLSHDELTQFFLQMLAADADRQKRLIATPIGKLSRG